MNFTNRLSDVFSSIRCPKLIDATCNMKIFLLFLKIFLIRLLRMQYNYIHHANSYVHTLLKCRPLESSEFVKKKKSFQVGKDFLN